MPDTFFKRKKVLIMGLGLNGGGVGAAEWFAKQGAEVIVTDKKNKDVLRPSLEKLKQFSIQYTLGKHREEDFTSVDLVVRNPDVPRDSPYLTIARQHKIPVVMEESLFHSLYPFKEKIIGVTGTRGKTTTTTLIGEIIKQTGQKVLLGGNLRGRATLSLLEKATSDTWLVLELSSWQLEGFGELKKSPHFAVLINIYPDHLNRYPSMREYIGDKKLIFKYQTQNDYLIANMENITVRQLAKDAKSKLIWFKKNDIPQNWQIQLLGQHNTENIAAAVCVGQALGIPTSVAKKAVERFAGVEQRLQSIRHLRGVTYVNDTTSTTPIAGIMALRAYAGKPIILIAGGNTKNLDLSDFANEMEKSVKALILLEGTATDELEAKVKKFSPNVKILGRFNDFSRAVNLAHKIACTGDVVLLSPGCTSFGMFANEFDRGDKFNTLVKNLV